MISSHSFNYDSLGRIVRHDSTQGLKSHVVYDKMNRVAKYSYSIPGESVSTEFHYNSKIIRLQVNRIID